MAKSAWLKKGTVLAQPALPFHGLRGLELAAVVAPLLVVEVGAVVVDDADQVEATGFEVEVGVDGAVVQATVFLRVENEAVGVGGRNLGALACGHAAKLPRSWTW